MIKLFNLFNKKINDSIKYLDIEDNSPRRIAFLYHDKWYKVFSYFPASSIDESLAVHSYLRSSSIGVLKLGKDFDKKPIFADKSNPEITEHKIDIHKVNIHKSGVITEKTKVGDSYKNIRKVNHLVR